MKNYSQDRGDSRRRGDSRPREMYKTVCSDCGNNCEVPFRPSKGKDVFCSNCFEKKDIKRSPREGGDRQLIEQVASINSKLDRILKVLET